MKRVCVFCGSSIGSRPAYREAAQTMGAALARRNLGLVYGGGKVGLMGAVADAVLAAGGEVIGVIPDFLEAKEVGHRGLTELRVVGSMHERKAMMAALSDGFIALPGGYGTLEEFGEILTWAQLDLHHKPIGLLDVAGYYDPLLRLFDHAVGEGFLSPVLRALVLEESDPARLLDVLAAHEPRAVGKWAGWDERDDLLSDKT
jgi:uncharacterized protein (TIGR00730 family)